MATVAFLGYPRVQFFNPTTQQFLVGGNLYTFVVGSTTPTASYMTITDATNKTNPNTNPVVLDFTGSATVVIPGPIKLVLTDGNPNVVNQSIVGNVLWTIDNYNTVSVNIYDSNGNALIDFTSNNNAVNYLTIANASTGNAPSISAAGSDTNVNFNVSAQGSGIVNVQVPVTIAGLLTLNPGNIVASSGNIVVSSGNIVVSSGNITASSGTLTISEVKFSGSSGLYDQNGNQLLAVTATTSAVNQLTLANAATTNAPSLAATGTDTNILLQLSGKGNSGVAVQGATSGSTAAAGYKGETQISNITNVNRIAVASTGVAKNLTSLSLSAGNWLVSGSIYFNGSSDNLQGAISWTSTNSATIPDTSLFSGVYVASGLFNDIGAPTLSSVYSFSSTTTVYLSGYAIYAAGTAGMCGILTAVRI